MFEIKIKMNINFIHQMLIDYFICFFLIGIILREQVSSLATKKKSLLVSSLTALKWHLWLISLVQDFNF